LALRVRIAFLAAIRLYDGVAANIGVEIGQLDASREGDADEGAGAETQPWDRSPTK
jgi:hypothetical protein